MSRDYRPILTIVLLLAFLFMTAGRLVAQSSHEDLVHNYGAWFMVFGRGSFVRLHPGLRDLRWWLDVQARFLDDSDYDQGLIRPGIGYAIKDEITIWIGYAYVHSDPTVGGDFDEHRVWQQFLWSTKFAPAGFQSRTRLEQRFVETGTDMGWRFRQLFRVTYPFDFEPRLGLAAYDELFFDLNDTDWGANAGFVQNRLFVGPSWKIDQKGRNTVEIGYLNQFFRNEGRSDKLNHIFSVNLLLNFN